MGWAKFDDRRHLNAKLRKAGLEASALDAYAITYSAADETDGFLEVEIVRVLAGCRHWRRLADALVDAGRWIWDEESHGWWIHDYLEYNPSKQELVAKRAALVERQRRFRQDKESGKFESDKRVSNTDVTRDKRVSNTVPDPTRPVKDLKEVKTSFAEQGKCEELETLVGDPLVKADSEPDHVTSKKATAKGKATKVRERDPLFDAMAEACGHDLSQLTPVGGKIVGVAVSQIRSQNPTPEIIWEKAELYKELHPTWELTPTALVKHWSGLQRGTERRTTQDMRLDELEQNVKEAVEQAKAKLSNGASSTPTSQSIGSHTAPETPRTDRAMQSDGFSHKVTNLASDRNSGADTPKTQRPNVAGHIASAEHRQRGLDEPLSVATLESEVILPFEPNRALEPPTVPLTETPHVSTTNNGSQDSLSEDFPSDADFQQWFDAQQWEESVAAGNDEF